MSATKLRGLVFGDLHWTIEPPSCRTDRYVSELEDYLKQIHDLAKTARPDFIACTGDWFHRKGLASNADVIRLIKKGIGPIVEDFGAILSIAGNHDMTGDNVRLSSSHQPIGVLEAAGYIHRVDIQPMTYERDGVSFHVTGVSYTGGSPRVVSHLFHNSISRLLPLPYPKGASDPVVVLTHQDLLPEDSLWQRWEGELRQGKMSNRWASPLVVLNGHLHSNRGRKDWSRTFSVCNVGSLARTSITERDIDIDSTLVTLTATSYAVRSLGLVSLPPRETFVDREDAELDDNADLDRFIASLAESGDQTPDYIEIVSEAAMKKGGAPVRDLATKYVRESMV